MNIVSIENLAKSHGMKLLFDQLSFGIEEGEKIGLIGVNGTGKSTLLKILAEREPADFGQLVFAHHVRVEYLNQDPEFVSGSTVLEQIFHGESPAMKLLKEYEQVLNDMEHCPDDGKLQKRLISLSQQMDEQGVWQLESEAKTVLTKLGISDFDAKVETLSGGMRKRIALAGALIAPAELLILDEPTNHLDYETVDWLEEYLNSRKGALIMVTHDRYFLDRVADKIFELDRGKLYVYPGNYGEYLDAKLQREEQVEASENKRQNLLRKELAWIQRGAKARTTKQKARIDRFEKLKEQAPEIKSAMEISAGSSRLGKKVIEFNDVSKEYAEKPVIKDFSYVITRRDRIGIIGANGRGKSTLLNLIAGQINPDKGSIERGVTVKIGYFAQENTALDDGMKVIDYLKEEAEVLTTSDGGQVTASQMLERFLFSPQMQWGPIGKLSGGEKRRLYLLRILMSAPNVILLDEPTNDLDVQTLAILEDYLDDFPGAVIAVSHDRYFLDRMAEKIFALGERGEVRHYSGNYTDYLAYREQEKSNSGEAKGKPKADKPWGRSKENPVKDKEENIQPEKKALKFSFKEQREFETIDDEIARTEKELAELEVRINQAGSNYALLEELVKAQQETEQKLEHLLERWTYLNELAEMIEENKRQKPADR